MSRRSSIYNDGQCCYCGKSFKDTAARFTIDHLVPLSKGGNNSVDNKRPCCSHCNTQKKNLDIFQYIAYLQEKQFRETTTTYNHQIDRAIHIRDYILASGEKLFTSNKKYLHFIRKYKRDIAELNRLVA